MQSVLHVPEFLTTHTIYSIRQSYDKWLAKGNHPKEPRGTEEQVANLLTLIHPDAVHAIRKAIGLKLRAQYTMCPLKLDHCLFTRLLPGGQLTLHADGVKLDGSPNHTPNRVATGIVYLTEHGKDHEGGVIRFPKLETEHPSMPGLLIGFPSTLEYQHQVSKVISGQRDAIVFWFFKDCACQGCGGKTKPQ